MRKNNASINPENRSMYERKSNIKFRKSVIRLYLRIVTIVLFLLIVAISGIYLFTKLSVNNKANNKDNKIKDKKLVLMTDDSGDLQLKVGADGVGGISIGNCVIVTCGNVREIGLLVHNNNYLITSFKLVNIKEPIFVELPNDEVLKGKVIEADKLKGIIVVKMEKHIDNDEFINKLDAKQYVYYKQIVDTYWKLYLEKQLNTQNIVIGDQKVFCVSMNKENKRSDGNKIAPQYNSGMILCNQFGDILGIDFINDAISIDENSYSFADAKYLSAIINRQLDKTYSILKKWGILVIEAKDSDNNINGIYIKNIEKESPLYGEDIYPTDIIVEVQSKKIINLSHFVITLSQCEKDYCIYFKIIRDGETILKVIKLQP